MKKHIHIWQFPKETTILLNDAFVEKMNSEIQKHYFLHELYEDLQLGMPFGSFKNCLKKSYHNYRPLWLIVRICKKLQIDLKQVESNTIKYRTKKSRITIEEPNLPIVVDPIFHMLMAHLIGDGGLVRFKDKDSVYSAYTQYEDESRINFIKKAVHIFGKFNFKVNYQKPRKKVFLPETVTKIILNYYGLTNAGFLSRTAIIPLELEKTKKDSLLAILIAFILDEGTIDSGQIIIGVKNITLARQLGVICNLLDYKNTVSIKGDYGFVYILKEGTLKFWKEYLVMCKKFPEVRLGYKEAQIEMRTRKPWRSLGANKTKNAIIKMLKTKPLTIKELSKNLLISRQGLNYVGLKPDGFSKH